MYLKFLLNFLITSLGKLDRLRRRLLGISLEVPGLRIGLPTQGTWVRSSVGELSPHAAGQLNLHTQLLKPRLEATLHNEKATSHEKRDPAHRNTDPAHRDTSNTDPAHRETDPAQTQHTATQTQQIEI